MQFITEMSEDKPGDTPQEQTGSKNSPATTTAIPQVVEAFEQSLQALGQEVVGWTLAEGEADARRKR